MILRSVTPTLWVEDLPATIHFYTHYLGFLLDSDLENMEWAHLHRDGVAIMFSKPTAHMVYDGPRLSGSLYINTDNADEWWEKLKDKVPVLYPIKTFPYGMREFAFYDCNGYVIQFGHPVNQ